MAAVVQAMMGGAARSHLSVTGKAADQSWMAPS